MTALRADVAVIGCGAVGASCAFRLAERGLSVLVLEQAEAPATGSSGRSAAGVRVQFTTPFNVEMSLLSIEIYRTFPERYGHDIGYRPIGYLLLVPEGEWQRHLETVEMQRGLGAPVEVLDPQAARRRVPHDTKGLAGATFGPIDGVIDPHWATHAWVALSKERGARFLFERPVRKIERAGGAWKLKAGAETVEAGTVVNAAGAWAGQVAGLAGLSLPVEPQRALIFLSSELAVEHPSYPMTIDVGSGFYLRSEGRKLLFGKANRQQPTGFHGGMDWPWLEPVLAAATDRFPWFEDVGVDHRGSWWGYYEVTPDHNPILGRHPDTEAWIDASGFSGHGIMHAPATGVLVAEILTEGAARSVSVDAYRHDRFRGSGSREMNAY